MALSHWLCTPAAGCCYSGVMITEQVVGQATRCQMVGLTEKVVIDVVLPIGQMFSFHRLMVDASDASFLRYTEDTTKVQIQTEVPTPRTVVELCSGMGGIGLGASLCGFQVMAQVDFNALVCSQLEQDATPRLILQASVADDCTAQILHSHFPQGFGIVAAGFNCQPFSFQGDRLGLADARSASFWGTLRTTFLLQPGGLLLECTVGAGQCPQVRQALLEFCSVMTWRLIELNFDLADQWPCRRERWWALCLPLAIPYVPLLPWPKDPTCCRVAQLIAAWPIWSDEEESQLLLTEEEIKAYFELYPEANRMLNGSLPCPTLLHSYGNATTACPCACRNTGFKHARLQAHGRRGVMITGKFGKPRFLHPKEVGFLLGFPGSFPALSDLRASLCLLGQSASPLQSFWLFQHVGIVMFRDTCLDPMQKLGLIKTQLQFDKFHAWPTPAAHANKILQVVTDQDETMVCRAPGLTKVNELIQAERHQTPWGHSVLLMDGTVRVPPDAWLQEQGFYGPYTLVTAPKKQALERPKHLIRVTFVTEQNQHIIQLYVGSFVFEALGLLEIIPSQCQLSLGDTQVFPDTRIWHDCCLTLKMLRGAGLTSDGLSMDFILDSASRLLASVLATQCSRVLACTWISEQCHFFGRHPWTEPPSLHDCLCVCVLLHGHWTLLELRVVTAQHGLGLLATIWDGLYPMDFPHGLRSLVEYFQALWNLPVLELLSDHAFIQTQPETCGTILLGHLGLVCGLLDPSNLPDIESRHEAWFRLDLSRNPFSTMIGQGKHSSSSSDGPVIVKLASLLREKGVPSDRAEERATNALHKLGAQELTQALESANPWQFLKAMASRPHNSFQWVHADELQAKVRARANDKFKIQHKPKKSRPDKRDGPDPLWIDPDQLTLVPGTFFGQDKEVSQLAFTEIAPFATGVAFSSVTDVLPYLRAGKLLGKEPLGVLTTTEVPQDLIGSMSVTSLRYPAQFSGTNEPILLHGSLIQLGASAITRGTGDAKFTMDSVDTQTLRLCVFRDQWEGNWSDFTAQPVRALLARHPLLTLCKAQGCGDACTKYHGAVDEDLDSLILDLWSRSWHQADSKYTKPQDAAYWSVLIRVPASAQKTIQGLSGSHGLYVEPRTNSGKATDDKFAMVWLGELALQDLGHKLRTTPNAVAIGRLRNKYGLRFLQQHLPDAIKTLKPGEPFVDTQILQLYRLYPLPFGTQRVALQKSLNEWGWQAKVRQAIGGGAEGTAWEVGASKPPPCPVLAGQNGDVTITLIRDVPKDAPYKAVLASSNTRKFLKNHQDGQASQDPWLLAADPWGGWKGTSGTAPRPVDKMQQLEDRMQHRIANVVKQQVAEAAPDAAMAQGSTELTKIQEQNEARFARLETGLTELGAQNQKFESWFSNMHHADQQMAQQLDMVTKQVEMQGHGLEQVRKELHTQVGGLQEGLNKVQTDVSSGFTRMEALLEKRARHGENL